MKTLYLDIFSGISGDMFIGALLDLGVSFDQLEHELARLHLHDFHLHSARKQKSSIEGIKFDVHTHDHGHSRDNAHLHTHAAFGIGTLHGLAGSSHFLGVLPALAFPTKWQAASYLLAYGIGTVVAMAAFSWGMGLIASRFKTRATRLYRHLLGACAVAAMGVGCFWLATSWH